MIREDLPAEEESVTGGLHTISYAQAGEGLCRPLSGPGWQPVDVVNRLAWQEIEVQVCAAREKVRQNRASCLYYYMIANQMNVGLLAGYTHQSRLRVLLHLRPFFFRRLCRRTLQRYAALFQVSVADLNDGRLKSPVYALDQQQMK